VIGRSYGTGGTEDKCVKILVGKLRGKRLFDELGIDGKIILKRILKK